MRNRDDTPAVITEGLTRDYGDTRALDGLDLTIERGTVHGVLGPNGAGKTTAVRILSTLLKPTGGRAMVAGFDVVRHADEVRYRIGLLGQNAALDEELSGRQNLELFSRLYHLHATAARRRATDLLEQFGLANTGSKPVKQYSGGMRRRLDLAASLIMAPEVLFLDEPTTGLDPRGRTDVWAGVRSLAGSGTTILLTTQYLDEADQLADRISVVDGGRVVAGGTAEELKSTLEADRIDLVIRDVAQLDSARGIVKAAAGTEQLTTDTDRRLISAPVSDRISALSGTVRALEDAGIKVEDLTVRRPSLDEVFLQVTGGEKAARVNEETVS